MNEDLKCNICLEDNNNIITFSKCRHHICLCCLNKLHNNTCPYCRGKFDKEVINFKNASVNKKDIKCEDNNDFYFEEYVFTEDDKEKFQIELTKEYLNSWYKYFSF